MAAASPALASAPIRPAADRRNAIGTLRLLLAGLVIFSHAHVLGGFPPEAFSGWTRGELILGDVAVQGFFVLSGWLIASSWRRQPAVGRFLWHRFLRLAPALWCCLLVTAFVFAPVQWLRTAGAPDFFALEPSPFGYVWQNLWQPRTQLSIGPFPSGSPWGQDWNGSLWTIFYEGACYLLVLAAGIAGLLGRWRVLFTLGLAGALALFAVQAALHPGWLPAVAGKLFDTKGKLLTWHFLAGAAWAAWPEFTERVRGHGWIAAAALIALAAAWLTPAHVWLSPWLLPPVILWFSYRGPMPDLEHRIGGDYSYGLYVYGYPVQQMLTFLKSIRPASPCICSRASSADWRARS